MGHIRSGRSAIGVVLGILCISALLALQKADATSTSPCSPVIDPYPGTRYEGVNLSHIRATGISCRIARHVARHAHEKALGLPLPASGVRHFVWHDWTVTGDLRGPSDSYVAKLDTKQVRWRF